MYKMAEKTVETEAAINLLIESCERGNLENVNQLVKEIENINKTNKYGKTSLQVAACNGYIHVVEVLISNGAHANKKDMDGDSALHHASRQGYYNIVKLLLNNNASIEDKNGLGFTPIHLAAKNGNLKTVQVILSYGGSVDTLDCCRRTPLHYAVENKYEDIVRVLLQYKASTNITDISGEAPLHLAVDNGYYTLAKLLIEHGANVNTKNCERLSPLFVASKKGYEDIASLLLEHNANPNMKNKNVYNNTAISFNDGIIKKLLLYGGKWNRCEFDVPLILECTNEIQNLERVKLNKKCNLIDFLFMKTCTSSKLVTNDVICNLRSTNFDKFKHYKDLLNNKFDKSLKEKNTFSLAIDILQTVVYDLPHDCYEKILNYVDSSDLKSITEVIKKTS